MSIPAFFRPESAPFVVRPRTTAGAPRLDEVRRSRRLDPDATGAMLPSVNDTAVSGADARAMSMTELVDHIQSTHHAHLRTELPRLMQLAGGIADKNCRPDSRWPEIAGAIGWLSDELLCHVKQEDLVLFPIFREMDAGIPSGFRRDDLAAVLHHMEARHREAGRMMAGLRELTDGFAPPENACAIHRALLASLAEFEADLRRHAHKESNVLFPRALAVL